MSTITREELVETITENTTFVRGSLAYHLADVILKKYSVTVLTMASPLDVKSVVRLCQEHLSKYVEEVPEFHLEQIDYLGDRQCWRVLFGASLGLFILEVRDSDHRVLCSDPQPSFDAVSRHFLWKGKD